MAFNLGTAIGYLDLDTSKFERGFQSAIADLRTASQNTTTLQDKFTAVGSAMTSVGSTLTKTVTLPLVGVGTAAVTVAANFESSMSRVGAIVGKVRDEEIQGIIDKANEMNLSFTEGSSSTETAMNILAAKAREMGATTKFSASEAADAMNYMAMAGWKTTDMLDGIEGIMNLAAASGEDLATTSDIVTDALTAFGLSAKDSSMFADVLAAASSNANTEVSLMGETFKYVAPVAGALGYDVHDVSVAIGLMANAGIKGSQAGTALRSMMSRLSAPTSESSDAMAKLRLEITKSDGTMKPFISIIEELRTKMGSLSEAEQAQIAKELAGQEAMSGLLAIVNAAPGDYEKLVKSINDSNGAAQEMADVMMDNLGGQLQILKSSLEELAISFGNLLLPMIENVVTWIQNVITWLNGLSEGQKETIVRIAEVAAAIGPILLIGGKIFVGISRIMSAWQALSGALSAGQGILATLSSVGFGPIIAVIAAVVAAVVALKAAWDTNFGGIRDKTQKMVDAIKGIFETLSGYLEVFLNFISGLWSSNWGNIQDVFYSVWNTIEHVFSNCLDILVNVFQAFQNLFSGNWSGLWENIKNIFSLGVDNIASILRSATDVLYTIGNNIIDGLLSGLKSAWNKIVDWASGAASWIGNIFNSGSGTTPPIEGSYASGLDYAPKNMDVRIHEGERILTKEQNANYPDDSLREEIINIVVQSVLDGDVIGENSYRYIKSRNKAKGSS